MKRETKERPPAGKNPLEWTVFGISLLLVLAVMGVLAMEALRWQNTPARLKVELGAPKQLSGEWCVPMKVTNEGEGLASNVEIEVSAGEEKAGLTMDFVPRGTVREGKVCFPEGIDPATLKGRVLGYEEP
jgi:uncharacterized protein (TIGR02588 family)